MKYRVLDTVQYRYLVHKLQWPWALWHDRFFISDYFKVLIVIEKYSYHFLPTVTYPDPEPAQLD